MIFLYLVAHKNRYPQFSWSGSKNEVESNTQEVTEPVLFVCFFLHWACNEKMTRLRKSRGRAHETSRRQPFLLLLGHRYVTIRKDSNAAVSSVSIT